MHDTANPAGVACVIVVVVTRPHLTPASLMILVNGLSSVPSG